MTGAVAGAAARKGGTQAAKAAGGKAAGGKAAGGKTAGTTKAAPRKASRPPSSRGYMDAIAAGGEKKPAPAPEPAPAPAPNISPAPPAPPAWADTGAGFLLALMFWTWVALPFLRSGPAGVKSMLKAKFTNKAPDGSWLP